ncbi:MAG: hypothetical protein JO267_09535 [Alphaproteobacteria bacterium]|nr:hypothetical protein [Alphaproteobacteria bacterium]
MAIGRIFPAALAACVVAGCTSMAQAGSDTVPGFSATERDKATVSTRNGLDVTLGASDSVAGRGASDTGIGTGSFSAGRNGLNATYGASDTAAGFGSSATGTGLGASSVGERGASTTYGGAGSAAGNGGSTSGLTVGGASIKP